MIKSICCSYQNEECVELPNKIPRLRVKYIHFDPAAYRRPPYYGTWRKKSKIIKPTKPLLKDSVSTTFFLPILQILYVSQRENIVLVSKFGPFRTSVFFSLRQYLIMKLIQTKNGKMKLMVKVSINQVMKKIMRRLMMTKKMMMVFLYLMVIYQMMKLMRIIELLVFFSFQ